MNATALALHATVLVTVLLGVPLTWRALRRDPRPAPAADPAATTAATPAAAATARAMVGTARRRYRPGWWLAAVILAIFVNQLLFNVYAVRVRHGDLSDLAADVPDGWFALADHNRLVVALAAHVPAAHLLSVTALRVPSLLELPFGLLAYLTVVNWLDPRRYRQLAGPAVLGLASAAYTVTFCLIEWALPTPYRVQDIVLRGICGVLCAVALPRLGRGLSAPEGTGPPRTASELLAFAASAAALGYLVLAMYDTVLLYSLGRAGPHLPGAAAACAVLTAARFAATRLRRRPPLRPVGSGLDTLSTGLSWWLGLFLIPALAIRYELGFGSWRLAAVAGTLVIVAATAGTLREVAGRLPVTDRPGAVKRTWLAQLAGALLAGALAAGAGLASPAAYAESRLLRAAVGFVVVATLVCAGSDRLLGRRAIDTPEPAGSNPSS